MLSSLFHPDASAVRKVLRGDRDAFAPLVSRWLPAARAVAHAYTRDPADAEDIAQEAFISAFRALPALEDPRKFGPWLTTIARRRAVDRVQRDVRRREAEQTVADNAPHATALREAVEMHELLHRQMEKLTPGHREALMLHYFAGHSVREVADLLEVSVPAAKKRLQRGREALGTLMIDALTEQRPRNRRDDSAERVVMGLIAPLPMPWATGAATAPAFAIPAIAASAFGKSLLVYGPLVVVIVLALFFLWPGGQRQSAAPIGSASDATQTAAVTQESRAGSAVTATDTAATETSPTRQATAADGEPEPARSDIAPAADEPTPATSPDAATVRGRVVDENWEPVAGIEVAIHVVDNAFSAPVRAAFSATSGRDGAFVVDGIDAFGQANVRPAGGDWTPTTRESPTGLPSHMQGTFTVEPGSDVDTGELQVSRAAATVSGLVVTSRADPIPQATVVLARCGERVRQTLVVSTITDARGRFALGVPEDVACAIGVQTHDHGGKVFDGIVPGTEARLVMPGTGAIEGRVTGPDGAPAPGYGVIALSESAGDTGFIADLRTATAGGDGRFRIDGLAADSYVVAASNDTNLFDRNDPLATVMFLSGYPAAVYGGAPYIKPGVHVSPGATSNVDLRLIDFTHIRGRVVEAGSDRPVPGALILFKKPRGMQPSGGQSGSTHWMTRSGDDGTYALEIDIDEPMTLVGVPMSVNESLGSVALMGEPGVHDVEPGGSYTIDIEVPPPFRLAFRVARQDGVPESGARVDLVAADGSHTPAQSQMLTDGGGRTQYEGVAPGRPFYAKAVLEENGQTIAAGQSTVIDPKNPPEGEVVITLDILGGVSGVALRPDGRPFANVDLGVRAFIDGAELSDRVVKFHVAHTDATGAFDLPFAFPEGTHTVIIGEGTGDDISVGFIENVRIASDATTDLGRVTLYPMTEEEYNALIHVDDSNRSSKRKG